MLPSQIGFGHGRKLANLVRGAVGDHAAEIEHHDLVGEAHHQAHVMLDQEHGDAQLVADRADESAELRHLVVIEAAGGLIEQQELRLRGERARELDALARRKGQARRRLRRGVLQSDEGQHRACGPVALALLAPRRRQRHGVAQGSRCGRAHGRRP